MDKEKKELEISVSEKVQIPLYSNIVQINVTDRDININFAFVEPNSNKGVMVSRIILTPEHAKEFVAILGTTIEKHVTRKKSK